jgi:chromosome segregation ATPase
MDFLARLSGKRDEPAPPPLFTQLDDLLAAAKGERRKLEAVLSAISADDAAGIPRVLGQLEERASDLTRQLDAVTSRADDLGRSTADVDALQARVAALEDALQRAEARADRAVQRVEDFSAGRTAIDELISQAQTAVASLEAAMDDARIAQVTEQLPTVRQDCDLAVERQELIAAQLAELQATTTTLMRAATAAEEVSKRVDEQTSGASERLSSLQRRLDEALQLERVTSDTATQLQTLNALAEHAATKVKALESQQQTIERALVDSRRVGEMVWEMNVQIDKLREGSTLAATAEETLRRLEQLHQDVVARIESATRERGQFTETVEQQRQKSVQMLHVLQTQLDRLALNRSELDTLNERLVATHSGLADTERRLAALSTAEETLAEFREKLAAFAAQTDGLAAQMTAIERKQPFLNTLEARLDELDDSTRRATVQVEALTRRRQELVAIRSEFDECEATYTNVRKLADELRDQKDQFALFAEQTRQFMGGAPALEAALGDLKTRVADTEARAERALAMHPQLEEMTGRLDLLVPRLRMVDELQDRLNRLHGLSGEIDERLSAQLSRQAELDRARVMCDGLANQIGDSQQRLALLEAAQAQLAAMPQEIGEVQTQLAAARQTSAALQLDQETVASQERRLTDLRETSSALFADISSRLDTLKSVQTDLARAGSLKDDLYQHLAEILTIERDTFERHHEAQVLLEQFSARWKQVDQRRAELGMVEQSVKALDERIVLLDRLAGAVDVKITSLAERDRIVDAVKQEIDVIHQVARQCQDNLSAIADQRIAISEGRADVERLAKALTAADEKLAEVERRSAAVDEVRRQADAVVCLLDDVRLTLDTVSEQKAMIDHVTETLAKVDDVIVEAKGTTRALQAERKLAQRIVEKVRNIHARAGADIQEVAEPLDA